MPEPYSERKPTVALCITGSIAAYKSVIVARGLLGAGVRVLPVMTDGATRFVGPVALSGITGEPVRTSMWDSTFAGEMHVHLAGQVDLVLIAPATADVLARLATGRADDLVSALALVSQKPVWVAPAMHPRMWQHPATMANVATLRDRGVHFLGPVHGAVASGDEGMGRMLEPDLLVAKVIAGLTSQSNQSSRLHGKTVLVTAGPTYEDIDPVRFIGNRSSGKMGFAIADAMRAHGAEVVLVAGPVSLATPHGVTRVDVRSALEMRDAIRSVAADVVVMAAAVADVRPRSASATKLKKGEAHLHQVELTENPDILAELGASRSGLSPLLVGFALETGQDEDVIRYAQGKLEKKKVDLVIANHAAESLARDDQRAHFVSAEHVETHGPLPKSVIAELIVDRVSRMLAARP